MSDSGYPQSEHSGSVSSRKAYANETRSRSHPYNYAAPRPNIGMNPDYPQNVYPNYDHSPSVRSKQPSTQTTQNGTLNYGYYQDNNSVMVVNSEAESDREETSANATYAHTRSSMYNGGRNPGLSSNKSPRSGALPVGYGAWYSADRFTGRHAPSMVGQHVDNLAEDARKKAQIQAYIAWVNVQLKKKAGTRVIEDLTSDLHDGVALADLIEIVAGESLEAIHAVPSSKEQMIENVEKVIEFMQARKIRMHHTTAIDIVEGNTKSIMRLILALAAHFKPNSVKQSSHARVQRGDTMAGIAQGAAAALAEARKDVSATMSRPSRPKQLSQKDRRSSGSDSDQPAKRTKSPPHPVLEGSSASNSPLPSYRSPRHNGVDYSPRVGTHSPRVVGTGPGMMSNSPRRNHHGDSIVATRTTGHFVPKSKSIDFGQQTVQDMSETSHDFEFISKLAADQTELASDVLSAKNTLLALQDLLLNGRVPDGEEAPSVKIESSNPEEEVVVLRSKLQQSEILVKELQEELSSVRRECMELQGKKAGVQQRLSEQEHSFLVMKADLLRAGFKQQTLENNKAEMEQKIMEKDKVVLDLRRELAKREREIDELKANFQVEQQQRDTTARNLRSQIQDLHTKLQRVGETEASLSARVASQDRKMARLEGKVLHSQQQQQQQYETGSTSSHRPSSGRSTHSASSDDMQMVKDSLHTLRTSFHGNDSQHHVIDQLECSISVLMDRLRLSETGSGAGSEGGGRRGGNYDSTGDTRRSPITAIHGFPAHRLDHTTNGNVSTKVLYFTDRTVTPFMCSIPKRLGEINLRDVKTVIDRPGNFRYHFKAMDPEFGTVKEEILQEEQIIPGWEGKIVAWVEEDHG